MQRTDEAAVVITRALRAGRPRRRRDVVWLAIIGRGDDRAFLRRRRTGRKDHYGGGGDRPEKEGAGTTLNHQKTLPDRGDGAAP
jgi:hypothetical protein